MLIIEYHMLVAPHFIVVQYHNFITYNIIWYHIISYSIIKYHIVKCSVAHALGWTWMGLAASDDSITVVVLSCRMEFECVGSTIRCFLMRAYPRTWEKYPRGYGEVAQTPTGFREGLDSQL